MPRQGGSPLTPVVMTMGDPAGIGPEIAIRAWLTRHERALPAFVLLASAEAVEDRARLMGAAVPIATVSTLRDGAGLFSEQLPLIDIALDRRAEPGCPEPANAAATIRSIETSVDLVVRAEGCAVVTNPISKSCLTAAGFKHPGHTEFLGHLAGQRAAGESFTPVMLLVSERLRVVPLTVHIPLSQVPAALTRERLLQCVRTTVAALRLDFGVRQPRIAVAGLNPHAGESGTMGREEIEVIQPAIAELRAEGVSISGPYPADTMFHAGMRKTYDVAIAMYHDQALIPLKTLDFDSGVNVTLGLPFVRTSPDHGTAFDIAAKAKANPESLIQAILMASAMAQMRTRPGGQRP